MITLWRSTETCEPDGRRVGWRGSLIAALIVILCTAVQVPAYPEESETTITHPDGTIEQTRTKKVTVTRESALPTTILLGFAALAGVMIAFSGVYVVRRGLEAPGRAAPSSTIALSWGNKTVKLANLAPGLVMMLIGAAVIVVSVSFAVRGTDPVPTPTMAERSQD